MRNRGDTPIWGGFPKWEYFVCSELRTPAATSRRARLRWRRSPRAGAETRHLTAAPIVPIEGGGPNTTAAARPLSLSYASRFTACPKWQLPFLFASSALAPKNFAESVNYLTLGRRRICEPLFRQAERRRGMHMRSISIAIAMVVAIGLIWSVAAMSKLVPLDGSEMRLAGTSRPAE